MRKKEDTVNYEYSRCRKRTTDEQPQHFRRRRRVTHSTTTTITTTTLSLLKIDIWCYDKS